jgi:hypothetical protein
MQTPQRETNPEGLTWSQWWRAALLDPANLAKEPQHYLDAWRRGEDPSEHAAGAR